MNKWISLALCSLVSIAMLWGQSELKGLKQGQLPNGLTYYVYSTDHTPGEVHFYLVQNVGGIVEDDRQQGLAHYLEHLAFNATEHFPEGVMKFLMRRGINTFDAKTGINETRYQISRIPTADPQLADSALLILKDWCSGLLIRPEDVEKERKIVTEEWRERGGVDRRTTEAIAPTLYNGTKYGLRNVIGREDILSRTTAKDLSQFYKQWYRPSLQCVMVIGDIDAAVYEDKIRQLFAKISQPKRAPIRPEITIPDNATPNGFAFVDRENTSNSLGIYQRVHVPTDPSKRDYVSEHLYSMMFNALAAQQFARLTNDGREAYIAATVSYAPLVRAYDQCGWDVVPYPGKAREALEQVLALRERLLRVGFSEAEFEGRRAAMIEDIKGMLERGGLDAPDNMMDLFRQNYLYGAPLLSIKEQINDTYEKLLEMEVEDLNAWMKSWMTDRNLSFITYSAQPGAIPLSVADFSAALAKTKQAPTLEFSQPKTIERLIDFDLPKGRITAERTIAELSGAKEWTLANGGKLIYKHVPELKDRFFFVASSHGGRSIIVPKDIPSFTAMQSLIMRSGVHTFNRNDLHHWLKGKDIELNISLDNYTEGLGGNAPIATAEDFFQYVHLIIAKQRFDRQDFDKYVSRQKYLHASRSTAAREVVQDSIRSLLFPPSAINPEINQAFYDAMRYEDLPRLFGERLASARDFTYCIVGALPEAEARQLTEHYIATLPSGAQTHKEIYRPLDFSAQDREIIRTFEADIDGNIGEVELSFTHDGELSDQEQLALSVLETLLQNKFFQELRERDQATYSVGVQAKYEAIPKASAQLSIRFGTSREKTEELKQRLYGILQEVAQGKVDPVEFRKSMIPHRLEQQEVALTPADNPMLWLAIINAYADTGQVPDLSAQEDSQAWDSLRETHVASLLTKLMTGRKTEISMKSLPPTGELKHSF